MWINGTKVGLLNAAGIIRKRERGPNEKSYIAPDAI